MNFSLKYSLLALLMPFIQTVISYYEVNVPDDISLLIPTHLIESARKVKQGKIDPASGCTICEQVVEEILSLRKSNATRDVMMDYFNRLCVMYSDWGTVGCEGRVNIETDTILYTIDHRENFKPARFCAIYFQNFDCQDPDADDWSIPLPPVSSTVKPQQQQLSDSLQILQLTDVHLDPFYTPGSNAKCSEPLCCESGIPEKAENAAGYWADYGVCDMPWHTVEDLMERIQEKHKHLDLIYFTGDIVNHRSWATDVESNSETIKRWFQLLETSFPNKTVYPILGNHETHPPDCYSPEGIDSSLNVSTQWLLDLSANQWSRWLPNDTLSTIKHGGYYTVLVKPGFRIIALNSNVCYVNNLWLVYENKDTYGQLQWLVEVLTDAEKAGEKVHILSHVPSSDDVASCAKVWSREFTKIVLRFSDTISAIFNGHSHNDEFKLYFDSDHQEVKSVAYNGASFATFVGNNPNYRIYHADSSNLTVTDYTEYIFNVTEANTNTTSSPDWYTLYSFKDAYQLSDLSFDSLKELYSRMSVNDCDNEWVDKYFTYMFRDSEVHNQEGCDAKCKKQIVCWISEVETSNSINC